MRKISNGEDSTLGNHRAIASAVFGEDSAAVKFLDDKIAASPDGEGEEVVMDEGQVVNLPGRIHLAAINENGVDKLEL